MKRKILISLLLALTLAFALVFASCTDSGGDTGTETGTDTSDTNTNTDTESNEITYTVKVIDYTGNPVTSGLFVQLYKDGEEFGSMKKANKEMNRYTKVATPYLSALRTVRLAEGYNNIDMLLEDYDKINDELLYERETAENEARQLAEQRKLDAERRKQQRKMKQ